MIKPKKKFKKNGEMELVMKIRDEDVQYKGRKQQQQILKLRGKELTAEDCLGSETQIKT